MRRFCLVPLALWILAAGQSVAENKVLFIGNSFTYGEGSTTGVPDLFDRLARAGGQDDPLTLMQAIGGADFQQHAGNSVTLNAINSQAWTHVVLQGHSSEPTHLTPNSGRSIADHLTYGRALYNRVMMNNSASKVVLFETWSRAASHPVITGTSTNTTFASTTQFQSEVRTNYRLLRDNLNNEFPDAPPVKVALVGSAWELAGALLPLQDPEFVDLFMADEEPYYGYHANDRGTYLAACVFYAKIYGSSPVGLHQNPLITSLNLNFGGDPGMPAYLESVAWEIVANGTDPVTIIGQPVAASVPEGHPVEFQAEITGEPPFAFQWKKDGIPISGATGNVLRIPAAWTSLNGAQFSVDISNEVSQVTSQSATLSVTAAAPYSVFLDFGASTRPTSNGPSPNDPARHWNNILPAVGTTSDGRVESLVTSQNVATLLDFKMLSRFNNSIDAGATVTTVGLPPNATRDTMWGNTEVVDGLTNVFPRFQIAGLAPSWHHTLTFFASRTGVSDNRQTRYTVTGVGSANADLQVSNNNSQTAVLSNVASTQEGNIEVALAPGPANDNSTHLTYLGSLQIDAQPGPAPPRAPLVGTASGSGSIVASPALPDYAVGELVELSAVPGPGWVFAGWSGDAAGTANPVVVMIDTDPAVTATFVSQNTAPTVSLIADRVINEDSSTGSIAFTIGDVETSTSLLVVNKYSSNPALVAPAGLVVGGSGANRTINVTPLPYANGTTTITISVSDGELSTERNFLVTVLPVNDPPLADDAGFSVAENSAALTGVGTVSANDPDAGDLLGYAITAGNTGDAFAIHPLTGEITVAGTLDYETQAQYQLTVTVTDDADPALSDTATITIDLTDINEAPLADDDVFSVAENSAALTGVGTVSANDPDAGDLLGYAITAGNTGDAFAIHPLTGEITVAGTLDYETQAQYQLTVTVTDDADPALSDTATITIDLTDINEAPLADDAGFSVAENSAALTGVGTVSANDPDAGDVLGYAITAGNTGDAFAIHPLTGEITVAGTLDYETQAQYQLTVTVTDDADPALSDTATITIDLTDINEVPLADDDVFSVAENSAAQTGVGTVSANDPDAGDLLGYAITAGNTGDAFAIHPLTGEITVAGTLDYETQPQYQLTVTVTDDADPALSDTATITIDLNDVNEAPLADDDVFSVAENSAAQTGVGTVSANDPDAGDVLGYAITAGNTGDAFAIHPLTGEITVAGTLDYETQPQYQLTVTVTDDADPALSDTATITIDLTDINEAPLADDDVFSVAENSAALTGVGTVSANDPDSGDVLGYAITAGNTGDAFAIDPLTGEITVAGTLDYETQAQYQLTVTVTDDADPALSDTATITIDLTDINEAPLADDAGFSVAENSAALTGVGTVSANDPDAGDLLGYAITAGNTGDAFAIHPLTGEITVAGTLDYETQAQYQLTVTVTDDADPALSDTATITIDLTDINEAPLADDDVFSVAENSAALTGVGTVSANDPDAGDLLGYAITAGNTGDAFAIHPLTGEITVAGTLDYETQPQYQLTVTVTDDADPALSDTATITIDLTDINEAPLADDAGFSVAENSAALTGVGTVSANDPDAGDLLGYAITAGNTGDAFAIHPLTGEITVAGTLDYETQAQYQLTVTVTDDADPALSDTATITIDLTDINEAPLADDDVFSVAENSAALTGVGTVSANDPDAGDLLGYAITAGNTGDAFAIDPLTGEITVAGTLDYETQPQYQLTVTVTDDADPALSDTATITIDLTDINEAPLADDAGFSVAENSAALTVVGTVSANDPDAGDVLGYAITAGNTGDAFAIHPLTGEITVAGTLDYETQAQYQLTVTVTDDADPALSDTATITIDLTDINEAPLADDAGFSVAENSAALTGVGTVSANDPDAGDLLGYAITAGNTGDAFAIHPLTGEITVAGTLDYETQAQYQLTVTVTDDADPALSDTATITIDLNDVNEAPLAAGQHVEVPEGGSVMIEFLGSDPDGDSLDYTVKVFQSHGTLSGAMPSFTYTPAPGYHGPDSICYVLHDGQLDSEPAEITITVISNAPAGFDEWLAGFGLTSEPSADSDVGGLNNLVEFLFGYDPSDPADDLLFRLELVPGDGMIDVFYPELKPVGDYHLHMAADPALLADPASRVETITKSQIEAMTETERSSQTYPANMGGNSMFFRLEFDPPPLE